MCRNRSNRVLFLSSAILFVGATSGAYAIDLNYQLNAPPFGVGYEHILSVAMEPSTLIDGAGDPATVGDFNFWDWGFGRLEARSSMFTDITAIGSGPVDDFRIISPAPGGAFDIEGMIPPGGGSYDGENSEFTGAGHGIGPGISVPAIWDVEILSTGEPLGTPVEVEVTAILQGFLTANMATHSINDDARATWRVVADGATVISSMEHIIDGPASISFHDDNLLSPVVFPSAVGEAFTLEVYYLLEVDGNRANAISTAGFTGSEVHVTATVVPEPASLVLLIIAGTALLNHRRSLCRSN